MACLGLCVLWRDETWCLGHHGVGFGFVLSTGCCLAMSCRYLLGAFHFFASSGVICDAAVGCFAARFRTPPPSSSSLFLLFCCCGSWSVRDVRLRINSPEKFTFSVFFSDGNNDALVTGPGRFTKRVFVVSFSCSRMFVTCSSPCGPCAGRVALLFWTCLLESYEHGALGSGFGAQRRMFKT